MKKNNLLKLLGIALVVAIVSTGVFYGLFVNRLSSSPGSGKTLVVAATALKAGTELQASDLKTIPWPAEQLPPGFYGAVDEVTGITVFDPIGAGEPVVASHLATAQSGGGVGIPSGMRAVSVHVTDSVSYTHLDVYKKPAAAAIRSSTLATMLHAARPRVPCFAATKGAGGSSSSIGIASAISRRRFLGSFSRHRRSSLRTCGGTLDKSGSLISTAASMSELSLIHI